MPNAHVVQVSATEPDGVHERAVMDVMGWSNSAMIKRYAHVTARLRRDMADQLNSYLWGGK